MTRTLLFDSPFLLGFDHIERLIERTAKAAAEGYPPYNVEHLGEEKLRITLAVAGFSADDLSVTVEAGTVPGSMAELPGRKVAEAPKSSLPVQS